MGDKVMFHTGSFTYKIYKYILKKKAVITNEIAEEFKKTNLKKHHISSYLKQLQKHGLIVKSETRVQSMNRLCSCSYVYGINKTEVKRKLQQLSLSIDTDKLGKRLVDVWKFDNDPIDYLIYVYDDIMDVPIAGYAVSIKRDKKGKYLGMAGKRYITSMIGCMSQGYSFDMRKIPQFNSLRPMLVMKRYNKFHHWNSFLIFTIFFFFLCNSYGWRVISYIMTYVIFFIHFRPFIR